MTDLEKDFSELDEIEMTEDGVKLPPSKRASALVAGVCFILLFAIYLGVLLCRLIGWC